MIDSNIIAMYVYKCCIMEASLYNDKGQEEEEGEGNMLVEGETG